MLMLMKYIVLQQKRWTTHAPETSSPPRIGLSLSRSTSNFTVRRSEEKEDASVATPKPATRKTRVANNKYSPATRKNREPDTESEDEQPRRRPTSLRPTRAVVVTSSSSSSKSSDDDDDDSGFKSGATLRGGISRLAQVKSASRRSPQPPPDANDDVSNGDDADVDVIERPQPRPRSLRPKSSHDRTLRPKSGVFSERNEVRVTCRQTKTNDVELCVCLQESESGCADCQHHVETIERQASDISQLTQTIDAHEQAFNLIQLNIGQLLHPDSDDDV